jgi:hypothetical protein
MLLFIKLIWEIEINNMTKASNILGNKNKLIARLTRNRSFIYLINDSFTRSSNRTDYLRYFILMTIN